MFLEALDPFGDGGLGDIKRLRGSAQAALFCRKVEDLQLIQIHNF